MTMFGLRKCSGQVRAYTGVPGGYRNPPGSIMGLMGLSGEEDGRPMQGRVPPPPLVRIGQGGGGAAPPFPCPSLLLPSLLLLLLEGVNPTPGGSRTPPLARPPWPAASPPCFVGFRREGRRREEEGKGAGPFPIRIGLGGAPPPLLLFPLFH